MFKEYFEKLLKQLSIDYNCDPSDFKEAQNVITLPALNEGRRSYSPGMPFLEMATCGENAVFMADECLHDFLHDLIKDTEGHHLFEHETLPKLDEELKRYGYQMNPTHHMFLP